VRPAAAAAIAILLPCCDLPAKAGCITEPIDKSGRAETIRTETIENFLRRKTIYKITRTSDTAVEVQVSADFLELPFDMKQVIAWTVFSLSFDGADEKQTVLFADSRTLAQLGAFDACNGLKLR